MVTTTRKLHCHNQRSHGPCSAEPPTVSVKTLAGSGSLIPPCKGILPEGGAMRSIAYIVAISHLHEPHGFCLFRSTLLPSTALFCSLLRIGSHSFFEPIYSFRFTYPTFLEQLALTVLQYNHTPLPYC